MLNWNIIPMTFNDSFTYMEWLGKLTTIVDNHENRITAAEETISEIQNSISEMQTDINGLKTWKSETVDPFIVDVTTNYAKKTFVADYVDNALAQLTHTTIKKYTIPDPEDEALGRTYSLPWENRNETCDINLEFSPGTISLGAYPFNVLNLTLNYDDDDIHKTFIQMIQGAYSSGSTGNIAYITISYYIDSNEIKIAITDGYVYNMETGASSEMPADTLSEITLSNATAKFYS